MLLYKGELGFQLKVLINILDCKFSQFLVKGRAVITRESASLVIVK